MNKLIDKTIAVIAISRPLNFIITFVSIVVAGLISSSSEIFTHAIFYAGMAGAFASAAGNIINDYYDIEIDRLNKPDRVLPSERLSKREALFIYMIFVLVSFNFALRINIASFFVVVFASLIIFLYSFRLKRIPLFGNFVVAFLTGLAFIFGGIAVDNFYGGLIPFGFALIINFVREIVKDMEDVEGDRKEKVITFPIKYGFPLSKKIVTASTIVLIVFTLIPFVFQIYKIEFFLIAMVVINPVLLYMLKSLYGNSSKSNLSRLSLIIKLVMIVGLIAIYIGV